MKYEIAEIREDGEFDVIATIDTIEDDDIAEADAEANTDAERLYPDRDWYVLRNGQNINA